MSTYPQIILKPGKEGPVLRFHPWIFSGAIEKTVDKPAEGDIVECFSSAGTYLATGHCMPGSLAVKLFTFERQEINREMLVNFPIIVTITVPNVPSKVWY